MEPDKKSNIKETFLNFLSFITIHQISHLDIGGPRFLKSLQQTNRIRQNKNARQLLELPGIMLNKMKISIKTYVLSTD